VNISPKGNNTHFALLYLDESGSSSPATEETTNEKDGSESVGRYIGLSLTFGLGMLGY
jgi:hypothetical protein